MCELTISTFGKTLVATGSLNPIKPAATIAILANDITATVAGARLALNTAIEPRIASAATQPKALCFEISDENIKQPPASDKPKTSEGENDPARTGRIKPNPIAALVMRTALSVLEVVIGSSVNIVFVVMVFLLVSVNGLSKV